MLFLLITTARPFVHNRGTLHFFEKSKSTGHFTARPKKCSPADQVSLVWGTTPVETSFFRIGHCPGMFWKDRGPPHRPPHPGPAVMGLPSGRTWASRRWEDTGALQLVVWVPGSSHARPSGMPGASRGVQARRARHDPRSLRSPAFPCRGGQFFRSLEL